ncbi:MAG TPA: hypothetical protein VGS96_02855, partial [Thermoanaerobaculia bacterium]|nr:hypothetical protein [Thermoanaerobaculia bacterium]
MRTIITLLLLVAAEIGGATPVIDQTIATLMRVQTFEQVAISPDGSKVAYVKKINDETTVYIGSDRVVPPSRRPSKPTEESDVAWSPDSAQLAFVSDQQLYVGNRAITSARGAFSMPKWSPDGK